MEDESTGKRKGAWKRESGEDGWPVDGGVGRGEGGRLSDRGVPIRTVQSHAAVCSPGSMRGSLWTNTFSHPSAATPRD